MTSSPMLELRHITHSFSGSRPILNGISLTLFSHKAYALMGANGSGKTTLLNVVGGYVRPNRGQVLMNGRDVTHFQPYQINKLGAGRTFQQPRLIKQLSVIEHVILAMRNNKTDSWYCALLSRSFFGSQLRGFKERAEEVLQQCFLQDMREELAGSLSFGQQKLLNIACVIANEATLLLLDEPMSGLSPSYATQLCDLLNNLKGKGKTILMIEHNQSLTKRVAEEYFLLHVDGIHQYESFESAQSHLGKHIAL